LVLGFLLLLAYGGWLRTVYYSQVDFVFPGARRPPLAEAGPTDGAVEQVWLTTAEGARVEGWFQPGAGCSASAPGPACVFFHGNGDLIDQVWGGSRCYVPLGVSFLAVEYRGYGRSEGEPSEQAVVADAVAFYDWLAARPEVNPRHIMAHGTSLGGAVATGLADRRPVAALVLECTFVSLPDLAGDYLVPRSLCRFEFPTGRVLSRLDIPVMIQHGRRDHLISIRHGRRLAALARRATFVELDCGHDGYRSDGAAIQRFVREHVLRGE